MSLRDNLTLLKVPGFGVLFAARGVSMLGMAFAPVALSFGILHLPNGGEGPLAWVLIAQNLPLVLFLLVGGVLADRFPRRSVMIVGEAMAAVSFAGLATLVISGVDARSSLVWLCVAAAVSGVGEAIMWPALTGIIPEIVPADRLKDGNAILSMAGSVARIVGLVSSGLVVAGLGGGWSLAAAAFFFAGSGVVLTRLPLGGMARSTDDVTGNIVKDLREGWSEFVRHEWLWVVVLQWAFLVMVFNGAYAVLGPLLMDHRENGATLWSWVLAGESVGALLGVLFAMRYTPKYAIRLPVIMCVVTIPTPLLLLGLDTSIVWIVLSALAGGVSFSVFGVLWQTTMQRLVPPEALSRVSSYDALGSMMFGPLGLALAPVVASAFGPERAMLLAAGALLVIAAAALLSRDVRTLRWPDMAAPEPCRIPAEDLTAV